MLVIWTDCDREGEHIGSEIVEIATPPTPVSTFTVRATRRHPIRAETGHE